MDSTPLIVVAHLTTPVIGLDQPFMLDGPLAWAWVDREKASSRSVPPLTAKHCPDFPLPLAQMETHGTWVWCTSQAELDVQAYTGIQIRRKPAVDAMARYAPDRKHHAGLGPQKARDTSLAAMLARTATWHVLCTDRPDLEDLLSRVTNLGGRHRNDFGHVDRWTIDTDPDSEAWRNRPWPDQYGSRAPYWHPTRRKAIA